MPRINFTTNIEADLLDKARETAESIGVDGVITIIENALRLYFANCAAEVWEKHLSGDWVKKMVIRPGKLTVETIRCRKVFERFNPKYYTAEALEFRGWRQVWKIKKA
jgi:hypothetical protein